MFYVAITRAEKALTLCYASSRFRYGSLTPCEPSRFIDEIDNQYLDMNLAGLKKESPLNALFERRENRQSSGKTPVSTLLGTNATRNTNLPEPDPNFEAGDISGLKSGDKVQHQRFGTGVVSAIEGEADNKKATVIFEGLGEKKLVLKFAKMRIIV